MSRTSMEIFQNFKNSYFPEGFWNLYVNVQRFNKEINVEVTFITLLFLKYL